MASYIIVCSEVRSTIGGVKTCFRLSFSFSGVLEYPGVNSISISSSVHLHRKILRNCKRISMDTSYLIINILLIATFLYKNYYYYYYYYSFYLTKMTLLNFDTQIMKIHFNFFHISVDFKFKKRSNN